MLTFNVFDATVEYDPQDPEPFQGGQNRFGPKLGARQLGATVHHYPDSNKITHWTDSSDPDDNVRVRRGQNLDYWDGEL